jgi:uncharacterized protein (TIGR04255 family)
VIFQLRHTFQHGYEDHAYLDRFQKALGATFPRTTREQQVGLVIGPSGATQLPPTAFWSFSDLEGHWKVAVAPDFVSVETDRYTQFEDFRAHVETLIGILLDSSVTVRERLGFRFVNEIRHPTAKAPQDWRQFINSDLLGIVGGGVLGEDVIHALQEIRLRQTDGVIAIRHGYLGQEASGGSPFYSLDLDYFDETTRRLEVEETLNQVQGFHDALKDVFETSITEDLRTHLVVLKEEPVV